MGKWIADNRKIAIYKRDKCQCVYCGRSVNLRTALDMYTLDHIVPRVLGGSNASENLITACKTCNSRKGKLTLKRFLLMNENEYNTHRRRDHVLRMIARRTAKPLDMKYQRI